VSLLVASLSKGQERMMTFYFISIKILYKNCVNCNDTFMKIKILKKKKSNGEGKRYTKL
jgi:hypothetical protein